MKEIKYSKAEQAILAILLGHAGSENAIKSRELALRTGIEERKVRDIIKHLIEDKHVPIGSSTVKPYGYYIITDNDERYQVSAALYGRAISILKRARAYDQKKSRWVSNVIGQLELIKD